MEKQLTKEQILAKVERSRDWFDLEQDIMRAWHVVDELDNFIRAYVDGEVEMTEDQVWNRVYGIREVSDARFQELWATFEAQCKTR